MTPEQCIAKIATEVIIEEMEALVKKWREESFDFGCWDIVSDFPDGLRQCANDLESIIIKTKKKIETYSDS